MNSSDKNQKIYLEERHRAILALLEEQSAVRINELSHRFEVSAATIRKDIRHLESQGKLVRTHGGAIPVEPDNDPEMSFADASVSSHIEKVRIGQRAAELVHDGDVFFAQSGTTCLEFVRALKGKRQLTLITCDLMAAITAEEALANSDSTIIILGGSLRCGFHYTQGPEVIKQLSEYHVPTVYLGTNAFSFEHGFSAHRIEQAEWVRALISAADRHVMLMDSSKIGTDALSSIFELSDLDCLITDLNVSEQNRTRFAAVAPNLEVIYA